MTIRTKFTPAEIVSARAKIDGMSADALLAAGYINVEAVIGKRESRYRVILSSAGEKKILAIKNVRSLTGASLATSKEIVDTVPNTVGDNLTKVKAHLVAEQLRENGEGHIVVKVERMAKS